MKNLCNKIFTKVVWVTDGVCGAPDTSYNEEKRWVERQYG